MTVSMFRGIKRGVGFSCPNPEGPNDSQSSPPIAFDLFLARVDLLLALFVLKIQATKAIQKKKRNIKCLFILPGES